MKEGYELIARESVPVDESGNCLVDLYVRLPASERFVRFIPAGDPLDENRVASLLEHIDPGLYVQKTETTDLEVAVRKGPDLSTPPPEFKIEVIGKETQGELKEIFRSFLDPIEPPATVLMKIDEQASKIVDAIAPETKDLKSHLMKNVKYLKLMNDASAITALAVLIALASGYDSKKSYKDLCYACLIMDAALSEFDDATIEQYYRDPFGLDPKVLDRIKKHPVKSHQLATEKMKSLSDVSLQLVLNHHELFNGKGYPRGVRYESLFPMVKVLSFAVDIFETIKRNELNGGGINFMEAVTGFTEENVEPHLRRHSKKLVSTVIEFLGAHPEIVDS